MKGYGVGAVQLVLGLIRLAVTVVGVVMAVRTVRPPKLLITSLRGHAHAKALYLLAGGRKDIAGDEIGVSGHGADQRLAKIDALALAEAEHPLVGRRRGARSHRPGGTVGVHQLRGVRAVVPAGYRARRHVDHIVDMRRCQVLIESNFPTELGGMFKNMEDKGNPRGQNAKDRLAWAEKLDFEVPVFDGELGEDIEYLFWGGCAGGFEDRVKKTIQAVAVKHGTDRALSFPSI